MHLAVNAGMCLHAVSCRTCGFQRTQCSVSCYSTLPALTLLLLLLPLLPLYPAGSVAALSAPLRL
jgi:hypothetical protein